VQKAILVIDDDPGLRGLLEEFMAKDGYRVVTADCGREGIAAIERARPDLVLLDIQMPGINGLEVLATIRRKDADLPVIVVTGYGSEEIVTQAIRAGADDYLAKPLRLRTVCARVRAALERAALRDDARGAGEARATRTCQAAAEVLGALGDDLAQAGAHGAPLERLRQLQRALAAADPAAIASLAAGIRKAGG